ncbi:MAG: hypothetical protein NT060_05065 [Candidatus Omnitrophica bacterium]|nr:hypothetical protein [Candidatus Omnitrophota bacterium]
MKNLKFWILFLIFDLCALNFSYAAPCYGTRMPEKNKFFAGLQNYTIYKRDLENNNGKLRSLQDFVTASYGVFDWLSVDLKGGAGYINQHPENSGEVRYNTGFAGGDGFRVRLMDKKRIKTVFGFQHISVHPSSRDVAGVKNQAILDDWQASLLASYEFNFATPYIGTRWSRVDYIHKVDGDRKRVMSDLDKSVGLIVGIDVPLNKKIWLNLEGSFFDSSALAFGLNYAF